MTDFKYNSNIMVNTALVHLENALNYIDDLENHIEEVNDLNNVDLFVSQSKLNYSAGRRILQLFLDDMGGESND